MSLAFHLIIQYKSPWPVCYSNKDERTYFGGTAQPAHDEVFCHGGHYRRYRTWNVPSRVSTYEKLLPGDGNQLRDWCRAELDRRPALCLRCLAPSSGS